MPNRTITIDIETVTYQAAVNRARQEGKSIGQLVADFLNQYAGGGQAAAGPTTYTVKSGDTLGRIATAVYGDARKYPIIQKANNIANASRIWVGQVLVIPAINGGPPTPTTTPVRPPPLSPRPTTPTVTPAPPPPVGTTPPPLPQVAGFTPNKPAIRWVGSPNYNRRQSPNDITAITIHSTANSTLEGVIHWFNKPEAMVSAHYTIGKDGTIAQHVRDADRAWHAGKSIWKGRSGCNDYCIGIELVNLNDGVDPYPEAQHQANVALCAYLCHRYNISTDDIMGHYDICIPPGRKSDPRNYNLNRLRREVSARLGR